MTGNVPYNPHRIARLAAGYMKQSFVYNHLYGNTKPGFIKSADIVQYSAISAHKEFA